MNLLTSLTPTAKLTNYSGGKVLVPTEAQFPEILVLETSDQLVYAYTYINEGG